MNNQIRIAIFWTLLVICMILHFDYHVSEIFYGIDVKKPDANGTVPNAIIAIRSAFHFMPMLILIGISFFDSKVIRLANLVVACIYVPAHAGHLAGEFSAKIFNPSQVLLLSLTLTISFILAFTSYKWFKEFREKGKTLYKQNN